jgi:2-succinyl-6-hydroxy-2,4-cyclohexadiene-1-carboxylate synthase
MIHLLHGAVGDPSDWDALIALLAPEQVRAVDLYGGKIESLDEFGQSLNAEASEGDVLIGYSMGGRLGLQALVAEGAPWSKAIIISAHSGGGADLERLERDAGWAELARRDWERFVADWSAQPVFGGKPMPWDRAGGGERREAIARGFERWSLGAQEDLLPRLGAVEFPVLWLAGEEDGKYVDIGRRACEVLPAGRLEVVGNCGHRVPWERAEYCAKVIRSFLS